MALRGLLIAAAATLAVAAAVVVGLPRLVDGEAARSSLEATVEAVTGGDFEVEGAVDATLFPRPQLVLAKARLVPGRDVDESPVFEVDRIELRPDFGALLSGQLRVAEVRLVRPRLDLSVSREGMTPAAAAAASPASALGKIELGRFAAIDGRLVVPGRDGKPLEIDGIAVEGRADTLLGPWQASGAGRIGRDPVTVNLELGRIDREGAGRLAVDLGLARSELTWTGRIWTRAPFRADGKIAIDTTEASEILPLVPEWIEVPPALATGRLRLAATLQADEERLDLRDATLDSATLTGRGSLGLDGTKLEADLTLDHLDLAALSPLVSRFGGEVPPLAVTVRSQASVLGDRELGPLDLALGGGGGEPVRVDRARLELAGSTTLRAEGRIEPTGPVGARFVGSIVADSEDLRAALVQHGIAPELLPPDGPRAMAVSAGITVDSGSIRGEGLDLQLDGNRIGGSAALTLGVRPQLAAALTAERLDLGPWLAPLAAALARSQTSPLDAAIDLRAERVLIGGGRLDALVLKAGLEAGRVRLQELAAGGDESVRLQAGGSYDPAARTIDAAVELETPRAARLLRLLGLDLPWLARLEPMRLSGTLRGPIDEATLDAEGSLASAALALGGTMTLPDPRRRFDLTARLTSPDAAAFAQALGAVMPPQAGPPLALDLAVARPRPERVTVRVDVATGTSHPARADLAFEPQAVPRRVSGRIEVDGRALGAVEAIWPIVAEPLGLVAPPPSAWPGAWPAQPLSWDWIDAAAADLELVRRSEDGRTAPLATLRQRDSRLTIADLDLPVGAGTIVGEGSVARRGEGVDLAARITAQGASGLTLDRNGGTIGSLDGTARLEAHGRSILDLARTLAGEIRAAVRTVRPGGNGIVPLDQIEITATVDGGVARGPLTVRPVASGPALSGDLLLDVPAWMVDATLPLPTGEMRLLGPPGALRPVATAGG